MQPGSLWRWANAATSLSMSSAHGVIDCSCFCCRAGPAALLHCPAAQCLRLFLGMPPAMVITGARLAFLGICATGRIQRTQ